MQIARNCLFLYEEKTTVFLAKGRYGKIWRGKFNEKSLLKVTGEQCSNKWKKLEEKYKKVKEHNSKTGNDRKECVFEEELAEFYGNNPKILPLTTVSALTTGVGSGDDLLSDEENLHPPWANKHAPKTS